MGSVAIHLQTRRPVFCALALKAPAFESDGPASQITIPTCIVHGDADDVAPVSNSRKLQDLIPGATLHVLPSVGHTYTEPGALQRLIEIHSSFFEDIFIYNEI